MRLKSQKGGAAVEFAIIAPLLFVILFGIIEFSILLYDKAMLTNASREGARVGIVFVGDRVAQESQIRSDIRDAVFAYCQSNLITFGSGTLTDPPTIVFSDSDGNTSLNSGDNLTVTVNYQFDFLVFSRLIKIFGGNFADIFNLQAVTVMRLE